MGLNPQCPIPGLKSNFKEALLASNSTPIPVYLTKKKTSLVFSTTLLVSHL